MHANVLDVCVFLICIIITSFFASVCFLLTSDSFFFCMLSVTACLLSSLVIIIVVVVIVAAVERRVGGNKSDKSFAGGQRWREFRIGGGGGEESLFKSSRSPFSLCVFLLSVRFVLTTHSIIALSLSCFFATKLLHGRLVDWLLFVVARFKSVVFFVCSWGALNM